MRLTLCISLVALASALGGCMANPPASDRPIVARVVVTPDNRHHLAEVADSRNLVIRGGSGLSPGSEEWRRTAINNFLATDYYRLRESRAYPSTKRGGESAMNGSWPRGLPRQCLALSGGGIRSAAFAMGAMDALHAPGRFDEVDVISSSSGGSYANFWFSVAIFLGNDPADVFTGKTSPALVSVRENAGRLSRPWWLFATIEETMAWLDLLTGGGSVYIPTPVARAIPQDFFQDAGATTNYSNVLYEMFVGHAIFTPMTLFTVGPRLETAGAPFPVINASALVGRGDACQDTSPASSAAVRGDDLAKSVFELTPLRIGSDGIGYALTPVDLPLAWAVAASGAAVDDPTARRSPWLGPAGLRMGLVNTMFRPAVDIATDGVVPGKRPGSVYVSLVDSAFSDNLAVFALVRRLCEEIIVVDGEHDPTLVFESYGYLKQHLARQGIEMSVPGIDTIATRNRVDCSATGGNDSSSECICDRGICQPLPRSECLHYRPDNDCVRPNELENTVFNGTIKGIPFLDESSGEARSLDIRVTYVKLALDEQRLELYPAQVRARYEAHADRRTASSPVCRGTGLDETCSFPHESTYDQDFREGRFEAYWELGRCNVERHLGSAGPDVPCADEPWPLLKKSAVTP